MKTIKFYIFSIVLFSSEVFSGTRFAVLDFTPNVNIHKETTSGVVEIVTKDNYKALYNVVDSSFQTIKMPFRVISKTEDVLRYKLDYLFEEHYCKTVGEEDETRLNGTQLLINGRSFKNKGFEYIQSEKEIEHMVSLEVASVRRGTLEKNCYGTIGFTLKLDTL